MAGAQHKLVEYLKGFLLKSPNIYQIKAVILYIFIHRILLCDLLLLPFLLLYSLVLLHASLLTKLYP